MRENGLELFICVDQSGVPVMCAKGVPTDGENKVLSIVELSNEEQCEH